MVIDYTAEAAGLEAFVPGNKSDFWKPKAGQYHVRALTELDETDPFQKEGEEPKPRVKIEIMIDDKKYTWTMAKGVSPASTYGQLCRLAKNKGNHLKDVDFLVVVTSDSKKNTYTIVSL